MTVELTIRIIAVIVGVLGSLWFLQAAIRTMVIPRPERVWITVASFATARKLARWWAHRKPDPARRHHILGSFAPFVLISLPLVWSIGVILSFSLIFWGLIGGAWPNALELSGSSLTTLGFTQAPTLLTRLVAIVEALIGLALVALVISFLPTLYSMFSRREIAVGELMIRAGEPPTPVEFLVRLHVIGRLDEVGARWEEWEEWFVELGETHTSFPALVYFRSAHEGRNWLTAAETALDTAAIVASCKFQPNTGRAETMIRAGYLALREIAAFYGVNSHEPIDRDELRVDRASFERLLDRIEDGGLLIPAPRDDVWHDFVGWRINYEQSLIALQDLVSDVASHWDRLEGPIDV